jgi:hypothetical protein
MMFLSSKLGGTAEGLPARPQRQGPTGGWVMRGRTGRTRARTLFLTMAITEKEMLPHFSQQSLIYIDTIINSNQFMVEFLA